MDVDVALVEELRRQRQVHARARTYESAARADSCITSPSCPVRVRDPLPAHQADLGREDLAADLGPGQAGGDAHLAAFARAGDPESRLAEQLAHALGRHGELGPRRRLLLQHLARQLAADGGDLALQVAHPGLARVALDEQGDRVVAEGSPRTWTGPVARPAS